MFKAGDIVVLELVNGRERTSEDALPTGYVYQLRQDYEPVGFRPTLDLRMNKSNGYSYIPTTIRIATEAEASEYKRMGMPCKIPKVINNYAIY